MGVYLGDKKIASVYKTVSTSGVVEDNLDSFSVSNALSANQGRVLNEKIETNKQSISNIDNKLNTEIKKVQPIANGGTGATNKTDARSNLGITVDKTHNIIQANSTPYPNAWLSIASETIPPYTYYSYTLSVPHKGVKPTGAKLVRDDGYGAYSSDNSGDNSGVSATLSGYTGANSEKFTVQVRFSEKGKSLVNLIGYQIHIN